MVTVPSMDALPCILCRKKYQTVYSIQTLGDLVEDTNPTPKNLDCSDPDPSMRSEGSKCDGGIQYKNTPYNNYMSYAGTSRLFYLS